MSSGRLRDKDDSYHVNLDPPLHDTKIKDYSAQKRDLLKYNKRLLASIVVFSLIVYSRLILTSMDDFNFNHFPFRSSHSAFIGRYFLAIGCLQFFDVDDASEIRWERDVNSRHGLKIAMNNDKVHMISGDVILKHELYPKAQVLMMGKPASNNSDITLKEWLLEVIEGEKGIRLHIHSSEALHSFFVVLSDINVMNPINFPVWIHADVLQGPFGEKPSVDMRDFISAQKKFFPRCTLSFGWTTGSHSDLSQSAYSWDTVWDMLDLINCKNVQNEIVFQARLSLVHNSVPQLKWLVDNVKSSSLMVWHEEGDSVVNEDVMYISYKFPPNTVYFNLNHDRFQLLFNNYRHFSKDKVDPHVLIKDQRVFKLEDWWKMGFYLQNNSVLPSTESIIITSPNVSLMSESTLWPSSNESIQGRIIFFNRNNCESVSLVTGLNIYVSLLHYGDDRSTNSVGIRCFIGIGGEIEVAGVNLPDSIDNFGQAARVTPTPTNCYRFKIVNEGAKIIFWVTSLHDCTTLESVSEPEPLTPLLTVPIPADVFSRAPYLFSLKMEDVRCQVLIDELRVNKELKF
ncbi:uncharacterized protein LOC106058670 isoform X2 [Biomphalaria glabrata]|uniref:Uncharacterized protein LOC106058670 isoform X2 n=1 Tax=Biomphalaria glabrata TaxID=6526 RepID=A0A9W3AGT9_BIOGL|nr:uncharacterized protein LOC106058670 isoform X2 [Biomphalaria glabrata]